MKALFSNGRPKMSWILGGLLTALILLGHDGTAQTGVRQNAGPDCRLIEDFESASEGGLPRGWVYLNERRLKPLAQEFMHDNKRFSIELEVANQFVRAHTESASQHIMLQFNDGADRNWDLDRMPLLRWRWRARRVPPGASEKNLNDTAAAIYVTFDQKDWLGRPRSIKYSLSSTLSAGTVVSSGNLKVLVTATADGVDASWRTVQRDVRADYLRLFGGDPPRPILITLWSDSDDTRSVSEADFDDIRLCGNRAQDE